MVDLTSTIPTNVSEDNKQTATTTNPSNAFQYSEDQMQQYPWPTVTHPLLSSENSRGLAALGASGSSGPQ